MLRRVFLLLALLALVFEVALDGARAERCPEGNLLAEAKPVAVVAPVVNDGRLVPEGSRWDAHAAATRTGFGPLAIFDLGEPTRVRSGLIQADGNDTYLVSFSRDGKTFEPAWNVGPIESPPHGLRMRVSEPFDVRARYARIDVIAGDGYASVSELQLYCGEAPPSPPTYEVVTAYESDRSGMNYRMALGTKAAICLAGLAVLLFLMKAPIGRRAWIAFALFVPLSAYAFTDLAHFHGYRRVVHPSDSFHYFFGAKYFDELGYFDLYTCVTQAEREAGHGDELARFYVRDLETNRLRRSIHVPETGPRCDGRFTQARWEEFRRDIDGFRGFFRTTMPLPRLLADHGYNGTPITTAFHRLFVHDLDATEGSIKGLTLLDAASNLLAILLVAWGLGPVAGILAGFVIAFGEPWGYQWVGGSLGRANFVLWLGAGIGLAGRGRHLASTSALTVSALFRLFPAVFVGAVGLRALVRAARVRALDREGKRVILAAFGTLALGVLLAGLAVGFDAIAEWLEVMKRHAANPPGNHLGLPIVLHFQPGTTSGALIDGRLSNPLEFWEIRLEEIAFERRALHWLGIAFAIWALLRALARGASHVQSIGFAAILLYSVIAITNYDGVWLLALVPLVHTDARRVAALLAFLASTQIIALLILPMETRCLVQAVLMYGLIVFVTLDALRELGQGATLAGGAVPAPEEER